MPLLMRSKRRGNIAEEIKKATTSPKPKMLDSIAPVTLKEAPAVPDKTGWQGDNNQREAVQAQEEIAQQDGYRPEEYQEKIPDATRQEIDAKALDSEVQHTWTDNYYDVRDFGAIGDGVIDDTAAIQAAIDKAEETWAELRGIIKIAPVVYFTPGTYLVTGLLIESHVTLKGAGMHVTVLKTTSNRPVIDIAHVYDNGAGNYQKDAMQFVSDMSIYGDSSDPEDPMTKPDQIAIRVNADCVHIERMFINSMRGSAGILLSAGITSLVRDCYVTECDNGTGIEVTAALRRIPCSAVGNGGPDDGDSVVGDSSGETATVRHYYANTLAADAGDIELYNVSGTFTKGENIEKVGDATTYVTVDNVGTGTINNYYLRFNTTTWVKNNKVRWNKLGILVDSAAWTWIVENLVESNISGVGGNFGEATRPSIGIKTLRTYNTGSSGLHVVGNYFENQVCDLDTSMPFGLIRGNTHGPRKATVGTPVTKSTSIHLNGGYRNSIIQEALTSGDDGVIYIDTRETLIQGCIWGSGTNRNKLEKSDLGGGNAENLAETVLIDYMLDGGVAETRGSRVHTSFFVDSLYMLDGVPMSAENFQADGGIYAFGSGYTATTIRYGSAAPTTGTWLQGDIVFNSDPDAGEPSGWVCVESGTFTAIAQTGDPASGSDEVTDISGYTNLRIGTFIDIAGVTGTFMVTDLDSGAGTITLDGNADATLDDAAITNHDAVFEPFGIVGSYPVTTVTTTTYTILETDHFIWVDTSSSAVRLTLPAVAGLNAGKEYHIIDKSGNCSVNNIIIDANGSEEINGELTLTMNVDRMAISLVTDQSEWLVF